MKVLILWAEPHSTNLGVQALGQGTAALVERVWPGADVRFQGYGQGDAPMRIGNPKRLAKESLKRGSELTRWLATFDLVIDTRSGDSFADIYGLERLLAMSAFAEFVRRAKVPLVLGPQTIGPFTTRRGQLLGRRSLATATLVMARDRESYAYSRKIGRAPDVLTTDVVFAMTVPEVERSRDVLLNVSGLLWQENPHVDAQAYRRTVFSLCRSLLASGRRVSLLAHVLQSDLADNDVPAIEEVAAGVDGELEIVVPKSLTDVRALIASGQVVIGSRMHACLNAISVGTPAIPLAYSRKFEPLLDGIGWQHTVDLRTESDAAGQVMRALGAPDLGTQVKLARERAEELLGVAEDALGRLP